MSEEVVFRPGDVVRLKSEPFVLMTVDMIGVNNNVHTKWFDRFELRDAYFKPTDLILVKINAS